MDRLSTDLAQLNVYEKLLLQHVDDMNTKYQDKKVKINYHGLETDVDYATVLCIEIGANGFHFRVQHDTGWYSSINIKVHKVTLYEDD